MATRNSPAGKNGALDPALPQKKRARRRLVGAAAVCLAAAIILPAILDSEPRHSREDVQVRIPSRETPQRDADDGAVQGVIGSATRAPGPAPDAGDARAPEADGPAELLTDAPGDLPSDGRESREHAGAASSKTTPAGASGSARAAGGAPPSLSVPIAGAGAGQASAPAKSKAEPRAETKTEPKAGSKPDARAEPKAAPKPDAKVEAKNEVKHELRPEPKAPETHGAFLLQAGAFATEKAALDQVARLRKAGQKAYTEKVKTSQGERIRVRIGPFASRDAAEKARAALAGAGVEAAVIAP